MKELPLREAHCNVNENEPFNPVPGGWSCSEEGTSVIANRIKSRKYQSTMPLPFGSNLHFILLAVITPFLTFYYFVFFLIKSAHIIPICDTDWHEMKDTTLSLSLSLSLSLEVL